jgi:hypothetical protein
MSTVTINSASEDPVVSKTYRKKSFQRSSLLYGRKSPQKETQLTEGT